jgi:hypothetical protein
LQIFLLLLLLFPLLLLLLLLEESIPIATDLDEVISNADDTHFSTKGRIDTLIDSEKCV